MGDRGNLMTAGSTAASDLAGNDRPDGGSQGAGAMKRTAGDPNATIVYSELGWRGGASDWFDEGRNSLR